MNVDGTLDPSRFASWIRQYKPALQVFPPVWKELQTLQAAQASIKTLQSAAEVLPKAMRSPPEAESEGARLLLGKPVDTAVRQALQDAHPHERVQEMMRLTGNDPAAVMGLRRQVWKELTERMKLNAPADVLWSEHAQPVAQIVKQYRPLLEQLYPPEHLKTLEKLAIGESILDRAPQAVKMANAEITRKSGIGGFIGTFWSRMFGVSRGVVGEPFLMTEGLSRGMVKALEGISQEKQREILEHAISDRLLDRIDAKLGHPVRDPHGDPIPAADGRVPAPPARRLSECGDGETVTVARISDDDPEMLRYFDELGITLDARLRVLARRDFAGLLSVAVLDGESEVTVDLGTPATSAIWVL